MQYPMNMEIKNERCVVLGGGHVALRKIKTLLAAEAEIVVIAPEVEEDVAALADEGKISYNRAAYERGDLLGAKLVICATNDEDVNRAAIDEARSLGILVNAPKEPHLSDFSVPASIRRGSLLVTVSTGDMSPALSRLIREKLEDDFPESFSEWLEILHVIREEVKEKLPTSRERENFWRQAMDENILSLVREGKIKQAEDEVRNAVDGYRA